MKYSCKEEIIMLKDVVKSYLTDLKKFSEFVAEEAIAIKEIFYGISEDTKKDKKLVSNYLSSLDKIASRSDRTVTLLARLLHGMKNTDLRKRQVKKKIDGILDDFDLTHRVHVKEFWDEWIPRLIDITDPEYKHRLISIETKKEFAIFRIDAFNTINNLSKSVDQIYTLCGDFETIYRKIELENLKNLTLEKLIESWELDSNPVTGELYDDIIR
jgi:hypothetical protein